MMQLCLGKLGIVPTGFFGRGRRNVGVLGSSPAFEDGARRNSRL
jgi:hypothetical protein